MSVEQDSSAHIEGGKTESSTMGGKKGKGLEELPSQSRGNGSLNCHVLMELGEHMVLLLPVSPIVIRSLINSIMFQFQKIFHHLGTHKSYSAQYQDVPSHLRAEHTYTFQA